MGLPRKVRKRLRRSLIACSLGVALGCAYIWLKAHPDFQLDKELAVIAMAFIVIGVLTSALLNRESA